MYANVLKTLPNIEQIENADFNQTTVITDRNWVELYKLFEENRDYISYDKISPTFVNAIVATEDQRFWENPWVDWKWTVRTAINNARYGKVHWWSTITQQVIKNILLTPEKNIARKLKEIILAIKLVKYVKVDISDKYENLSDKEIDRKVKEKILELYSNYIFLWNNSYWLEIASQTYFWKKAIELDVLEWAILAWIPQAPSKYNPYSNRGSLMWDVVLSDKKNDDGSSQEIPSSARTQIVNQLVQLIDDTSFASKTKDTSLLSFLTWLLSWKRTIWWTTYDIEYVLWRKDYVLSRLYDESYITETELKEALQEWFTKEFNRDPIEIKAPHFVFWVIQELEKRYDQEVLRTWWLTIQTTLDFTIQRLAEQSIEENLWHIYSNQASNASLVYTDSHSGDILAYVWSKDYNNEDIDGQVDMVQAQRQPWSTIKPLIYSLWFINNQMTVDSPIYDINMKIGNNEPQNADGEFRWLTTVKKALAWSRNIPAIKMFMNAWWEPAVKTFLHDLWMSNLIMDRDHYGYALSLWAAETPMLELANAYAHLSAMWKPAKIDPVLEVRWADWSILYKKEPELQKQIIPSWVSYLIWNILSNKQNFPESRRKQFTFPWIDFATKSGTTNVVRWDEKFPRDWRLATYTPSKVLVMRAWNTDWSSMKRDAYGWWINSPVWKSFVWKLKANGYLQQETMQEREVKQANISLISWKLANYNTPLAFMKKSLGYIHSLPTEYDDHISAQQVDTLCYGKPTDLTPKDAIGQAWYIRPETIMSDKYDQKDVLTWRRNGWASSYSKMNGQYYTMDPISGECKDRVAIQELWEISMNLMQPEEWQKVTRTFTLWHQTKSPFKITDMKVYLWDIEISSTSYNKEWSVIDISDVKIPAEIADGEYVLKAIIRDEKWYSDSRSVKIKVWSVSTDTNPPYLVKDKIKVTPTADGGYSIVLLFGDDASTIWAWSVSIDWTKVHSFDWNVATFTVKDIWTLTYEVKDWVWNSGVGKVILKSDKPEIPVPSPEEDEVKPEVAPEVIQPENAPEKELPVEQEPIEEQQVAEPVKEEPPLLENTPPEKPEVIDENSDDVVLQEGEIVDAVNRMFPTDPVVQ